MVEGADGDKGASCEGDFFVFLLELATKTSLSIRESLVEAFESMVGGLADDEETMD